MRKYIIFSLFFHLLSIFIMDKTAWNEVELEQPAPNYIELIKDVEEKTLTRILAKPENGEGDNCKKFYYGIGIYYEQHFVTGVMPGYPAYRIGIKNGDELLSKIPNTNNTRFKLIYRRNYTIFKVNAITEKICTN